MLMLLKGVAYCHTHSIMHRVRPHTDVAALCSIQYYTCVCTASLRSTVLSVKILYVVLTQM